MNVIEAEEQKHERIKQIIGIINGIPLDRLAEICDAEREGNLEIVARCKDCRYIGGCISQRIPAAMMKNGYCTAGERREAAEAKE